MGGPFHSRHARLQNSKLAVHSRAEDESEDPPSPTRKCARVTSVRQMRRPTVLIIGIILEKSDPPVPPTAIRCTNNERENIDQAKKNKNNTPEMVQTTILANMWRMQLRDSWQDYGSNLIVLVSVTALFFF